MKTYGIDYSTKNKAINMFLAGVKKGTICKKFHIKHQTFDNWVEHCDFKEFRKRTAFKMYKTGYLDNEICRKLGIGTKKLEQWIKQGYEKESMRMVFQDAKRQFIRIYA